MGPIDKGNFVQRDVQLKIIDTDVTFKDNITVDIVTSVNLFLFKVTLVSLMK